MTALQKLKDGWQRQARRIDTLTLRERGFMFVSLAVALVAVTDTFVLSPRIAEQKALTRSLRLQATEIETLRKRLVGDATAETPATPLLRELSRVQAETRELDAGIQRLLDAAGAGSRLPSLLTNVLRRHERLTLLRLSTIEPGVAAAQFAAAPTQAQAQTQTQTAGNRALPRQAVELALRGSYPDLLQYLTDTESALPALRWGELVIKRKDSTTELSATVYLVGATP